MAPPVWSSDFHEPLNTFGGHMEASSVHFHDFFQKLHANTSTTKTAALGPRSAARTGVGIFGAVWRARGVGFLPRLLVREPEHG